MRDDEHRCPSCGALVGMEAEWCGQCFSDLRTPVPAPESDPEPLPERPTELAPGERDPDAPHSIQTTAGKAFWPCPVCGARNPILLDICETCGTPFAAVMRGTTRRDVDPQAAFTRSLVFPGAGHAMLGYGIDGFARAVLFVLSLGVALFLLFAGLHRGPMLLAVVLSLGLAIAVYVVSAMEIAQLAARGRLLVPSKYLLWAAVVVMFFVVAAIALSVATSARR